MALPKTAQDAYNQVARFLIKHAKTVETPEEAFQKFEKQLDAVIGVKYAIALDMMIRVYYNVEDFVSDGEPMDQVWEDIENMVN